MDRIILIETSTSLCSAALVEDGVVVSEKLSTEPRAHASMTAPFIKELLLGGDDIRHIVSEICSKAEVFNPTIHADDVTVIGVKVNK